jgi:hypothetical protein
MYAVYAAYGKAMMAAHSLERQIATLLIVHVTEKTVPGLQREEEIDRIGKITMGQLISRFKLAYSPSDELQEELDNMLFFRNELAHRIVDTVLHATMQREWEGELIQELSEWTEMFHATKMLLEPYSEDWFRKHGIDQSKLLQGFLSIYPGIQHDT